MNELPQPLKTIESLTNQLAARTITNPCLVRRHHLVVNHVHNRWRGSRGTLRPHFLKMKTAKIQRSKSKKVTIQQPYEEIIGLRPTLTMQTAHAELQRILCLRLPAIHV